MDSPYGVIEGFYGQPWSREERRELFEWMGTWGLNTYLYAPKDDLKHRSLWREPYSDEESVSMAELIRDCQGRGIEFVYALSPGLDIQYGNESEQNSLRARCGWMLARGCKHFALLFDDIPDHAREADIQRFGSLALAQAHATNALFEWVQERQSDARLFFCPTPYCGRMRQRQHGGPDYLPIIGRELAAEIDIFWTGPEIISSEITVDHVGELHEVLGRKPVIWDNLHANDYDGRRFFCGPYSGRPQELREHVRGILVNPNNEFPLNYVPLRTLGQYAKSACPWNARDAYLAAMREWLPRFDTVRGALELKDLVAFGDCYYLPHAEGPEADALLKGARGIVRAESALHGEEWVAFREKASRLKNFCVQLAELKSRPLFYALSRRVWELREELDLLEKFVLARSENGSRELSFMSDFHLPGTYRGGFVARLQAMLVQQSDGTFQAGV